jgi:orotidine-5'-phosphate decarboxylase
VAPATFYDRLDATLHHQRTCLCVGLDPDPERTPAPLRGLDELDALRTFLEGVVEATQEHCAAFKFQLAAFLAYGPEGIGLIPPLMRKIGPERIRILDLKAGDFPNTMRLYGRGVFDRLGFEALTASPYLGWETVDEIAKDRSRGVFVLAHTSNPGSKDVQERTTEAGRPLWEELLGPLRERASSKNLGAVVGATFPAAVGKARQALGPEVPILAPGVGAQGGDLEATLRLGRGSGAGALLINNSRGVLYASTKADWKEAAGAEARRLAQAMRVA